MGKSEKESVLFITSTSNETDGVEEYSSKISGELASKNVESSMILFPGDGLLKMGGWKKLISQYAASPPRVIHFQYGLADLGVLAPLFILLLRICSGAKIVVTPHERVDAKVWYVQQATGTPDSVVPLLTGFLMLYDLIISVSADVTIVHTKQHASQLRLFPLVAVEIIPHYISKTSDGNQNVDQIGSVQTDTLESDTKRAVLTTFGRVTPKKGHEDVIKSLTHLEDIIYIVAGEPPDAHVNYKRSLEDLCKELSVDDRVFFTGYVKNSQIKEVFKLTDIAVLPYRMVTQSGAMYDALSYECPVITTDLPAFELVRTKRVGENYENQDIAGLLSAIRKVINNTTDYRANIAELNSERSISTVVEEHLETYRSI